MDEIFKQYGSAIVTVLAIIAIVGIIALIIGNGNTSVVYTELSGLVRHFFEKAQASAGVTP